MKKYVFSAIAGFFVCFVFGQTVVPKTSSNGFQILKHIPSNEAEVALQELRHIDFFSEVRIESLSTLDKVRAGSPFKKDCQAKFSLMFGEKPFPLSNTDIIVCFPEQTEAGVVYSYEHVQTDADGIARFSLPVFQKPLLAEVTFMIQLFSEGEGKNCVPREFELLNDEERQKLSVSFPCKVGAKKRTGLKACIDIADFDENGKLFGRNTVATSLLGELMRRGYLYPGNYDSRVTKNSKKPMEDAIAVAAKEFAGNVKDYLFGRTSIIKTEKLDDGWEATCEINAKIWNMKTNTCAKEITCQATASGKTAADAISKARQKLGAEVLADALEFGFEFQ